MGRGYRPELDGLRALAALLVFVYHSDAPFMTGGFVGVDVFFVLSGYLITSLLKAEVANTGRVDLWQFFIRRVKRLYPALLFMLVGFLAFSPLWPGRQWEVLFAGLYFANFTLASAPGPYVLSHTWSLAVEAQFYVLWPLVFRFIKSPVVILALLYASLTALRWSVDWQWGYPLHFSGLVLGALLTYLPRPSRMLGWPALALIVISAVAFTAGSTAALRYGITIAELASALVIACLRTSESLRAALSLRPLVWLGTISYAFYLWHYLICWYLKHFVPWPVILVIALPLTIGFAMASAVVERRFRTGNVVRPAPARGALPSKSAAGAVAES
jgi:peptidoglycan/LPS O-acetylase OafA/YrhL